MVGWGGCFIFWNFDETVVIDLVVVVCIFVFGILAIRLIVSFSKPVKLIWRD